MYQISVYVYYFAKVNDFCHNPLVSQMIKLLAMSGFLTLMLMTAVEYLIIPTYRDIKNNPKMQILLSCLVATQIFVLCCTKFGSEFIIGNIIILALNVALCAVIDVYILMPIYRKLIKSN